LWLFREARDSRKGNGLKDSRFLKRICGSFIFQSSKAELMVFKDSLEGEALFIGLLFLNSYLFGKLVMGHDKKKLIQDFRK